MFRTSSTSIQTDLFTNVSKNLRGERQTKYNNTNAWQNLFWQHITSKIHDLEIIRNRVINDIMKPDVQNPLFFTEVIKRYFNQMRTVSESKRFGTYHSLGGISGS